MNRLKKLLSVTLSLSLLWTSCQLAEAVSAAPALFVAPSNLPQFRLIPPEPLGRISDYYNASTSNPAQPSPLVILIQDLHAHYGVQQNIAGLLDFLSKKFVSNPRAPLPFALAVEGASGPVDNSVAANFPDASIKELASRYLMKEGELTGAEYFSIMHGLPTAVNGVENGEYYRIHRDLFRKTWKDREALVTALKGLQENIQKLPKHVYKGTVKSLYRKSQQHDDGLISDTDYLTLLVADAENNGIQIKTEFPTLAAFAANGRLDAPESFTPESLRTSTADLLSHVQNDLSPQEQKNLSVLGQKGATTEYYLYLRELIYQHQLFLAVPTDLAHYLEYLYSGHTGQMNRILHEGNELAYRLMQKNARTQSERDLILVTHDLNLLLRLADLQATEEEVHDFAPRLPQFIALTKSLLADNPSGIDLESIRPLISSSVDYYVMALLRNQPMAENTLALMKAQQTNVAVLVAGGFHTDAITQILQKKNISYLVITPTVDSLTDADHDLYIKRLNGELLTEEDLLSSATQVVTEGEQLAEAARKPDNATLATGAGLVTANIFYTAFWIIFKKLNGLSRDEESLSRFAEKYPATLPWTERRREVLRRRSAIGSTDTEPSAIALAPDAEPTQPLPTPTPSGFKATPGYKDLRDNETSPELKTRQIEFENLIDPKDEHEIVSRTFGRVIVAYVVRADLGSIPSYHFFSQDKKANVVVYNSRMRGNDTLETYSKEEINRELFWLSQKKSQADARRIATAELESKYAGTHSPSKAYQDILLSMGRDDLQRIIDEHAAPRESNATYKLATTEVLEISARWKRDGYKLSRGKILTREKNIADFARHALALKLDPSIPPTEDGNGNLKKPLLGIIFAAALTLFAHATPQQAVSAQPQEPTPGFFEIPGETAQNPSFLDFPSIDDPNQVSAMSVAQLNAWANRLHQWKVMEFDQDRMAALTLQHLSLTPAEIEAEKSFNQNLYTLGFSGADQAARQAALKEAEANQAILIETWKKFLATSTPEWRQKARAFLNLDPNAPVTYATLAAAIRAKDLKISSGTRGKNPGITLFQAEAALRLADKERQLESSTVLHSGLKPETWWKWVLYAPGNAVHEWGHYMVVKHFGFTLKRYEIGRNPHIEIADWETKDFLKSAPHIQAKKYFRAHILATVGIANNFTFAILTILTTVGFLYLTDWHLWPFMLPLIYFGISNIVIGTGNIFAAQDIKKGRYFLWRWIEARRATKAGVKSIKYKTLIPPIRGDRRLWTTRFDSGMPDELKPAVPEAIRARAQTDLERLINIFGIEERPYGDPKLKEWFSVKDLSDLVFEKSFRTEKQLPFRGTHAQEYVLANAMALLLGYSSLEQLLAFAGKPTPEPDPGLDFSFPTFDQIRETTMAQLGNEATAQDTAISDKVNFAFAHILGYKPEDILSRSVRDELPRWKPRRDPFIHNDGKQNEVFWRPPYAPAVETTHFDHDTIQLAAKGLRKTNYQEMRPFKGIAWVKAWADDTHNTQRMLIGVWVQDKVIYLQRYLEDESGNRYIPLDDQPLNITAMAMTKQLNSYSRSGFNNGFKIPIPPKNAVNKKTLELFNEAEIELRIHADVDTTPSDDNIPKNTRYELAVGLTLGKEIRTADVFYSEKLPTESSLLDQAILLPPVVQGHRPLEELFQEHDSGQDILATPMESSPPRIPTLLVGKDFTPGPGTKEESLSYNVYATSYQGEPATYAVNRKGDDGDPYYSRNGKRELIDQEVIADIRYLESIIALPFKDRNVAPTLKAIVTDAQQNVIGYLEEAHPDEVRLSQLCFAGGISEAQFQTIIDALQKQLDFLHTRSMTLGNTSLENVLVSRRTGQPRFERFEAPSGTSDVEKDTANFQEFIVKAGQTALQPEKVAIYLQKVQLLKSQFAENAFLQRQPAAIQSLIASSKVLSRAMENAKKTSMQKSLNKVMSILSMNGKDYQQWGIKDIMASNIALQDPYLEFVPALEAVATQKTTPELKTAINNFLSELEALHKDWATQFKKPTLPTADAPKSAKKKIKGGTYYRSDFYAHNLAGFESIQLTLSPTITQTITQSLSQWPVTAIVLGAAIAAFIFWVPHLFQLIKRDENGERTTNAFSKPVLLVTALTAAMALLLPHMGEFDQVMAVNLMMAAHFMINNWDRLKPFFMKRFQTWRMVSKAAAAESEDAPNESYDPTVLNSLSGVPKEAVEAERTSLTRRVFRFQA